MVKKREVDNSLMIVGIVAIVAIVVLIMNSGGINLSTVEVGELKSLVGARTSQFTNPVVMLGCETFNVADFENGANMVAKLSIWGVESFDLGDVVAAFDEFGDCRGISQTADYGIGYITHELYIYSNAGGEEITFKAYDFSRNMVFDIVENWDSFVSNEILGSFEDPIELHVDPLFELPVLKEIRKSQKNNR